MFQFILILLTLLGFDDNVKPKYDLHKRQEKGFVMTDKTLMIIIAVVGSIIFISMFFLIVSCTDSGLFYNHFP